MGIEPTCMGPGLCNGCDIHSGPDNEYPRKLQNVRKTDIEWTYTHWNGVTVEVWARDIREVMKVLRDHGFTRIDETKIKALSNPVADEIGI